MKYLILLLLPITTSYACISIPSKFEDNGFFIKTLTEKNPDVFSYDIYVPSKIDNNYAKYAYIYLSNNDETIINSVTQIFPATDLKSRTENSSKVMLSLVVSESHLNGVEIHVHYERKNLDDSTYIPCGPV